MDSSVLSAKYTRNEFVIEARRGERVDHFVLQNLTPEALRAVMALLKLQQDAGYYYSEEKREK